MSKYVLVTAARNEEDYIRKTIESVIDQTVLPLIWVIVSDNSTDSTDDIVSEYVNDFPFIHLIKNEGDEIRNFGSKAMAISRAYSYVESLKFDFVGNLDADVTFGPKYFESVISKFDNEEKLGLVGGVRYDLCQSGFKLVNCSKNSVGGPCQFFRRECFEAIGGYLTLKYGGVDAVAEVSARMLGWQVETFKDICIYHHRKTGGASKSVLRMFFRSGIKEYVIGYHPLFMSLRALFRFKQEPVLLGSMVRIGGFCWAAMRRFERPVSNEFVRFLRMEQLSRLRSVFSGRSD